MPIKGKRDKSTGGEDQEMKKFLEFLEQWQRRRDETEIRIAEIFARTLGNDLRAGLDAIARAIEHQSRKAVSSTLTLRNAKGEPIMQTVNLTDQPGSYLYQEFSGLNGTGTVVPPTGTVAYASDNPSVATIDPVTGQLAYVSAGVANISASDGGNLPATDQLTVVAVAPPPPVAQSSTITFVPPAASSSVVATARHNAGSSSRPA